MKHRLRVRIYYEDTDCGGVVYYANYLKYFDRARTELLEGNGISLGKLMERGLYFVVAGASLRYLLPGRYGDVLTVETAVGRVGAASITFVHDVIREDDGSRLASGEVRVGCVGRDMKPLKIDSDIRRALEGHIAASGQPGNVP